MFRRYRMPCLQQLNERECGPACLAMVLCYYGRVTSVAEMRDLCSVGRDGTSILTLVKVARSQGLDAKAFRVEPQDIRMLRMPAIVYWGFTHYVVLEHWSGREAVIVDPATGRRRVTASEFSKRFTGVMLTFQLGPEFVPRRRQKPYWRRYLKTQLAHSGVPYLLAQVFVASTILQVTTLAFPLLMKLIIDYIVPQRAVGMLQTICMLAITSVAAQAAFAYVRSSIIVHLRARLDYDMIGNFVRHLLSAPIEFFLNRSVGDLLLRLSNNFELREVLATNTISALLDSCFVAVVISVLLVKMPVLGIVVLLTGLAEGILLYLTNARVCELARRDLVSRSKEQAYMLEVLRGIQTLKGSGSERHAYHHWTNLFNAELNVGIERNRFAAKVDTVVLLCQSLAPVLLLSVGAAMILGRRAELGTVLAFIALATAVLSPIATLISSAQQFQVAGAHMERMEDVLEAPQEQPLEEDDEEDLGVTLAGPVEVRNVSFRFTDEGQFVLHDVSFRIESGQKVALVGETGSGKTTLARLLLGLYKPTKGAVMFNGRDLETLNRRSVRRHIGLVSQDVPVFHGSVYMNIAFHNPTMREEDVIAAAQMACIEEDICAMPMGYDTNISEEGSDLSGGQRQRIAIARALAVHPDLLLLDEATNSLDAQTEARISTNISKLKCTRLVISHHLTTIRDADRIIVLNKGTIVEHGTHEQLMARRGQYWRLYGVAEEQRWSDGILPGPAVSNRRSVSA